MKNSNTHTHTHTQAELRSAHALLQKITAARACNYKNIFMICLFFIAFRFLVFIKESSPFLYTRAYQNTNSHFNQIVVLFFFSLTHDCSHIYMLV